MNVAGIVDEVERDFAAELAFVSDLMVEKVG